MGSAPLSVRHPVDADADPARARDVAKEFDCEAVPDVEALFRADDGRIALISGSRYNARSCDARLEALGFKDSVCVGLDDRLPLRLVEERVDFPSAMPYNDFMERFHQACVDELAAFTDFVAGRSETPGSAREAFQAFRVAIAGALS
jgi:myo-inositol 2-dehydrogenase / D-chiro-inositol 1-dehydrogenase